MIPYIKLSSGRSKKVTFKLMINSPRNERKLSSSSFLDQHEKMNKECANSTRKHSSRHKLQKAEKNRCNKLVVIYQQEQALDNTILQKKKKEY